MILNLLRETLEDGAEEGLAAPHLQSLSVNTPLLGQEAVVTSLELVSVVADVEMSLMDDFDLDVMLVSEEALSRSKSPFRSADALADYVLELQAEASAA